MGNPFIPTRLLRDIQHGIEEGGGGTWEPKETWYRKPSVGTSLTDPPPPHTHASAHQGTNAFSSRRSSQGGGREGSWT
eukprot:scaffold1645_cov288-Pavlova_lutheri.AAC.16